MKILKKGKYLISLVIGIIILTVGIKIYASPTASNISSGPIRLIYDYVGHYNLNYTGNTNNYAYWNEKCTNKLVNKNYRDRLDIAGNNSSASISKTDGKSKIVKAYLIWETRASEGVTAPIVLITPNNDSIQVVAETACKDIRTNAAGQEYVGMYTMATDVTNIVCSSNGGYGTYTVADIPIWNGAEDHVACGGEAVASWQLVIVEESPEFPLRTISLNLMSQYFFNVDYTISVDFADASSPNGVVTATFLNGLTDVYSSYTLDGTGYPDDYNYEHNEVYYRYKTLTRGLYKNGVSINNRDTGSEYGSEQANGAVRVHLYDDKRRDNSAGSQDTVYHAAGTNTGINFFLYGVAIDIFAYDVRFDGNGADAGSMKDMNCIYGRGYTLPKNTFKRDAYEFTGWNTKADGSGTSYLDKAYIHNLTATEKEVILYAQWKPIGYKITLDSQIANILGTPHYYEWYQVGNYEDYEYTKPISKIKIPQKQGHMFDGYYTKKNGAGTQYIRSDGTITAVSTTFTQDTTLYANWMPKISKISLDNQGADTEGTTTFYQKYSVGNYATSVCKDAISKITNPTKTYYVFKGYFTGKNGEGQRVIDPEGNIVKVYTLFEEDTTLYAYWEPVTYTITLDHKDAANIGTDKFYEKYGVANYISNPNMGESLGSKTLTFNYTGAPQMFVAPFDGTYTLTAYGASGENKYYSTGYPANGIGGRTDGEVYLKKGDILWIYVGGAGQGTVGGYNGGGNGGSIHSGSAGTWVVYGGGGATDFRKGGMALSNRIMVAGGGGGPMILHGTSNLSSGGNSSEGKGLLNGGVDLDDDNSSAGGWTTWFSQRIYPDQESPAQVGYGTTGVDGWDRTVTIYYYSGGSLGQGGLGGGGGYYGGNYFNMRVGRGYYSSGAGGGTSSILGVENGVMYNVAPSSSGYPAVWTVYYSKPVFNEETGYYRYEKVEQVSPGNGRALITYEDYATELIESISITIPQKEGYRFAGYYSKENGAGTCYIDESGNILSTPTTFTEDRTLYAHWIADNSNTYKIAFHGNGATSGKMNSMICDFGKDYILNENTFTRTGYDFTGWNTKADGSGTFYADKTIINNLSSTKGEVITLYAQWKAADTSYMVNHYIEKLGGDWKLYRSEFQTGKTGSKVITDTLKESLTGFTYSHAEVKGLTVTNAVIQANGSLIINLYYTRNSYTVTLNKENGIQEVIGAGVYKYEEAVTIDAVVEKGYSWYNWMGTYISDSKMYRFKMPAGDVVMTATTSPIICKISLDNQRATEAGTEAYYQKYGIGNYAENHCTTKLTSIQIPKKTGYEFNGYYTKTNGSGTQYITKDGTIIADSTTFLTDTVLYADWEPTTYIVRFEGNGSVGGSMEDFHCTYGELYQLPMNRFVKTHYAFNSWNTKADGSGITYVNGSMIENLTSVPNGVITLYAQWTPNQYSIHFDANGGEGYMDDMILSYDIPQHLPLNTFTRNNGYGDSIFLGWNIVTDTRAILYADGAEIVNATELDGSTLILYAVWDDCPWIEAGDLYYSLKEAKNGMITYDELMSHAIAFDREEGENIPSGVDEENGTSFTIMDYQSTDFTQFTSDGSVSITYQVVDSSGNAYQQTIMVYIVDTEPQEIPPIGTTRFISEKYYKASYENGGLEDDSIWKTDPEYVNTIKQAFENSNNNTPIMSFYFKYEDILEMKEYIYENGVGNSVNEDALERFYVKFLEPNTVN